MLNPESLYSLPVSARVRICWGRLKQQTGPAIHKGTIHHIAMPSDPPNVCHAPKQLTLIVVECMLVGHCGIQQVSCRAVTQTL